MIKNIRIKIVLFGFLSLFLIIIIRLYYWQISKSNDLSELARNQYAYDLDLPGNRGKILYSDETILVSNESAYLCYLDTKKIKEKKKTASLLSPLIIELESSVSAKTMDKKRVKVKYNYLLKNLDNPEISWLLVGKKINNILKNKIEKLNLPGIVFQKEEKRYYPGKNSLAYVLGIVGSDNQGQDKGYFGLEGYYDLQLKGKSGKINLIKDAFGKLLQIGAQKEIKPRQGRTLVLSIDAKIQHLVEKNLSEGIKTWGAKSGNVIVLNPKNGEVLAMSSIPYYDPEKYKFSSNEDFINQAVSDVFEPGSIMKPLIIAAVLEENLANPETKCPRCAGPVVIGEYTIRTFNNQYKNNLTLTEVLINSDNTGMVFAGSLLGKQRLMDYLHKFDFGDFTGIDLEGEEEGYIKKLSDWYAIDAATITFGQGIAVTPIQMIKAYSALANNGLLVNPYIVKYAISPSGEKIILNNTSQKKILNKKTAQAISKMLISVTDKSPLRFPKNLIPELSRYKIAAKSGTAQIPLKGKYDQSKTIASVIGYFPVQNPRYLIYVRLIEPTTRIWGSDTAGPIFFNIIKDLIYSNSISPD